MPARTQSGGHRRVRALLTWAAALSLAAVAVPVAARATGWEPGPLAVVLSFMPWVTLAAVVPVALAAIARRWPLTAAAGALLAVCVAWQAPLFVAEPAEGAAAFTVVTANLSYGEADADAVVALVADSDADVLALQELTTEAVVALREAGLDELMPHSVVRDERGASGVGLWSRHALADEVAIDGAFSWTVYATVAVDGQAVTVASVHPAPPQPRGHDAWSRDLSFLAELLEGIEGPVVVAGDFNATRDHATFRRIEALGFADAADQAGAGWQFTFPEGGLPLPVVAIDHVLERDTGWVATGASAVVIPRTDHRALVVDYSRE